ncbi:MAG: phenylalanine--tRNA ligase subunit alpha [Candidatus Woesearchaeota archaeon]
MEVNDVAKSLSPLERKTIKAIVLHKEFSEIVNATKLKDVEVMRALQWLQNKDLVTITEERKEIIEIGKNGKLALKKGLPERRALAALKESQESLSLKELTKKASLTKEESNVIIGLLRKKAAIDIKKEKDLVISLTEQGKKFLDKEFSEEKLLKELPIDKSKLKDEKLLAFQELKNRKEFIEIKQKKVIHVSLTDVGKKVLKSSEIDKKYIEALTPELLSSGKWKKEEFRLYDVKINVPKIYPIKRHFENQVIEYVKRIWLELGFKEMKGNIVQTAFWDLDALFIPQDHPARDVQDTFYLEGPKEGKLPKELFGKIKAVHENGADTNSKGWQYKYSEQEAKKLLLRTHTTVLSAQTIHKLKASDLPQKYFSVGKVFRNETLDTSHLFEFYQVEGIVVDENANFRYLIGYLKEFFGKMGYSDIRIRPHYFPYTEPSAEIDVFHPIFKKWIELGGCGIFRPEVTKTLIGKEVPVLAWGLGLARTEVEYFNISDLRDIYKNDLKQLREMKVFLK